MPEADPYAMPGGGSLPVRLLADGEPVAGTLVTAIPRLHPMDVVTARTGADGRATLALGPGVWLVKAVTVERTANGDDGVPGYRSRWASLTFALGYTHIVPGGLDHILFVLGIFLLSTRWRPLLSQVTAFTVAHSITLGLSLYGVVALPPGVVEPLIALSIVYVAVENLLTRRLGPWRIAVVFGFAGVLADLGLPRPEIGPALLGFNVGVELGQLTVLAAAFVLVASWGRRHAWYRRRVVVPVSLAIAAVGLLWTVERALS